MRAQGIVLLIAGVWLLAQTLAGDLPRRVASYASRSTGGGA